MFGFVPFALVSLLRLRKGRMGCIGAPMKRINSMAKLFGEPLLDFFKEEVKYVNERDETCRQF